MKIPEIEFRELRDPGLYDFMDYVLLLLNGGRYEFRVINTVPTWDANEGEALLYALGSDRRFYVYIDGQWCYAAWVGGGGALNAQLIHDADNDTKVDTEESADEDIIRMDAGGTEIVTADVDQFAVNSGIKLGLEGNAGDTYWKYNSATTYLEAYVNNEKRLEM